MRIRERLTTLAEAYEASGEAIEAGRRIDEGRACFGGFAGASLAFFLAARKVLGPVLVVTSGEEEADELAEELEAFGSSDVLDFPPWDLPVQVAATPDGGIFHQRLATLEAVLRGPGTRRFIVAPVQAVLQPVPSPAALKESGIRLECGREGSPLELARRFALAGLHSVPLVEARGEFSMRGDILDVFPWGLEAPLRIEFFGDAIESIRSFQAESQRSLAGSEAPSVEILLPGAREFCRDLWREGDATIADWFAAGLEVYLAEPMALAERAERIFANLLGDEGRTRASRFLEGLRTSRSVEVQASPVSEERGMNLGFSTVERYGGDEVERVFSAISTAIDEGSSFEIFCESDAEARRFEEILADHSLGGLASLRTRVGRVRRGFEVRGLGRVVLTAREIFRRHIVRRVRRKTAPGRAIQNFLELKAGDLVVHLVHGVGRFRGIEAIDRDGVSEEFLAVEYRDGVVVYVPVGKIDLVQKYIGSGDRLAILDKVGGASWARKKEAVEKALVDLASELLEIQAIRRAREGFAFPPASEWQREFEAAFAFEETPDQVEVTAALHSDMEASRPMDRLICGDVGYGKTELAMRAVFKAVDAGKQVAVLVPTTVLAQQHFRTFGERMSGFPVRIEVLSRFRSAAEQREVIERVASGGVDVLVGTHRILSADVSFRDLGLVVIDEEQRFGVVHKETLKRMRSTVDVLTLTATPIPRTLHLALLGIRDISSLTTAPEGRCPVKTEVIRFEPRKVRDIMIRELNREGQIYFVHNRIDDIALVTDELRRLVPEARIDFAHGQMHEHALEDKMLRFFEGELDCLVSTTIIESGLDIPNVNTIFIDGADRYGLADLHQLRGRVGRYKHQAWCYLILPEERAVNPDALRRVQALVEFAELGAGFQIAMRDLEIRGSGNILGAEQSGHIASVGYDMYCRLLEKAARELRGEAPAAAETLEVEVSLSLPAYVPDTYRSGEAAKIAIYRSVSSASSPEAVDDLRAELLDRFGPLPPELELLLDVQLLRVLAARQGVTYIGREENLLVAKGGESLARLLEGHSGSVRILDARTVALPLVDPRRRHAPKLPDERVFRAALDWFSKGRLPVFGARSVPGREAR